MRAVEQGPYSMEVLVKAPAGELVGRGRTYIQAIPEREYSLRLSNNTGERWRSRFPSTANSIDAKRPGLRGSKWILGPWESITLDGCADQRLDRSTSLRKRTRTAPGWEDEQPRG